MKIIEFYTTAAGKQPCRDWLDSLDALTRRKILAYITRVAGGGAKKNVRPLGNGVCEIKVDYGPGYRVYIAKIGNVLILLLMGGDKSTQFRDIRQAKDYWGAYEEE